MLSNEKTDMFKVIFLLLTQLLPVSHGFSQEQDPEFNLPAMPSPTVASLARYTDFPEVDQFGLAPITIPLYEVKLKNYSLPITLSYHAGGVRVSQESSWVGLGFDLTAVGFISRSVRDLADDMEVERSLTTSSPPLLYQGWLTDPDYFESFPNFSWAEGSNDEQRAAHVLSAIDGGSHASTKIDGEPDIFYMNIGNIREKFVFDHQGQVAFLEPNSKLQVTYTLNDRSKGIREFIVVDSEGNKYYFGSESEDNTATEETTISSEYTGSLTPYSSWLPGTMSYYWPDGGIETRHFRTTWFIRRIFVQSCHQNIDFAYEASTEEFDVPLDQYYTKQDDESDPQNPKPILHMLWSGLRSIKHQTQTKYLDEIVTPDLVVDFDRSDRNDLQGAKKLDEMSVTSVYTNKVVEQCVFGYEVRQSEGEGSDYERNRLYLASLTKMGMPPFEFFYSSAPMPDKRSYKQDLWGFPCAKSTSFIPRIYVYPNETDHLRYSCFPILGNEDFELLQGSDRTADESSILAGSLERIKLPTGGSLQIVLQPNDFYDPDWGEVTGGGLRIWQINKLDEQDHVVHKKEYNYTSESQSSGRLLNGLAFAIPTTYSIPSSTANMYFQKIGDPNIWDYFTLRKSSNYFPLVNHDGALVTYENVSIVESGNGKIERVYYPSPNFKSHATDVKWASPYTRPPSFLEGNSTNSYVATGNLVSIDLRDYNLSQEKQLETVDIYELVDGSRWTSFGPPASVNYYFKHLGTYIALHITDYNPLHSSIYITNNESQVDMGQVQKYGTNIFPFPPISDDGNADAGKLKEERYFVEGDQINPIKKISYSYTAVGTPVSIFGLVHASDYVCNIFLTPLPREKNWAISNNLNSQYFIENNLHMYLMPKSWAKYQIIANQAHKIETEITIENHVEKTSSFTYTPNFMIKTLSETTSSGELKVTSFKYADAYTYVGGVNAINRMRDLNIVSKAIEKEVTIPQGSDARMVLATLKSYKLTTDGLIVLDKSAEYKPTVTDIVPLSSIITPAGAFVPDERYVDDFEFEKYDARGNLLQYKNRSGIVTSLIWGHNNSLLIAKVDNTALDQQEEIISTQLDMPAMDVPGNQEEYFIVKNNINIPFTQDVILNCTVNRGMTDPSIPDYYFNVQLGLFTQDGSLVFNGSFGLTTLSTFTIHDLPQGLYP